MNRRLLALMRIQALENWRHFRERLGGGRSGWGLLLLPLLVLAFVPAIAMLTVSYMALYLAASMLGFGELLITVVVAAGQILCLMFGVFYVISAFYFSKDLSILLPLPIRPSEIALSKFLGILVGEYMTIAPVVVPGLVVYGLAADVSWTYVPFAVMIFLLLPVVPLVLSALFSLVLMRVTNLGRRRDVLRVVGSLIGVALAILFGQLGSRFESFSVGPDQVGQVQQFLQARQGMAAAVTQLIPTSRWATEALRAGAPALGSWGMLLYLGTSAVALGLLVGFAEWLLPGGLTTAGDGGRSRRLTAEELRRDTGKIRSPLWALLLREIRLLNRTPTFLMNALLPVVLLPLVMFLPLLQEPEALALVRQVSGPWASYGIPAAALGMMLFISSVSNLASTAISREGRFFWILRSLPVSPTLQIRAKVLHSVLFNLLSSMVVMVGVLLWMRLLTPLIFLYLLVAGTLGVAAGSYLMMVPDILRPNLTWTDPQRAMKGNLNVLISTIIMMAFMGLLVVVSLLLWWTDPRLLLPALLLIFGLLTWGLDRAVTQLAEEKFLEYEA
ncbi:MAG TPA: hypothetical protein VIL07_06465 [Symbiobacteriaceae bacterium]